MRSFEEQKAEIFRRSEERIKRNRQNRKRILLSCVNLIFCFVVANTFYGIWLKRTDESVDEAETVCEGSGKIKTVCIMTSDSGGEWVAEDPQAIDYLMGNILMIKESASDYGEPPVYDEGIVESDAFEANVYTITVNDGSGYAQVFTITGNILKDVAAGREKSLTEEELMNIKELFGITE